MTSCYHEVCQILQSVTDCYFKVCQVLQSVTVVSDWDIITGAFILTCSGKYTNVLENTYE